MNLNHKLNEVNFETLGALSSHPDISQLLQNLKTTVSINLCAVLRTIGTNSTDLKK